MHDYKVTSEERCGMCSGDGPVAIIDADDPWQSVVLCAACLRGIASDVEQRREDDSK